MSYALAETVNDQIRKLIEKCADEDGAIHNRFDIAVIGYGKTAYSAWKAPFEGRGFVTVEELSNAMHESSSEVFPWIDPRDDGKSSKGDLALKMAYEMLKGWMDKHNMSCINDFRGRCNAPEDIKVFERLQYLRRNNDLN